MKIIVKTEDHRIFLPIPTGFLFHRPVVRLGLRIMRSSGSNIQLGEGKAISFQDIPEEKLLLLCDELRRIKRKYGSWDLVEVESASGDQVLIRL